MTIDRIKQLQKELAELRKNGQLRNMDPWKLEALKRKVNEAVESYVRQRFNAYENFFTTQFRRNYLYQKQNRLLENNIGLKSYKLNQLNPKFEQAYKAANWASLNLIKSQGEDVKNKLKHRFYDWITLSAVGQDKAKLREMTKVPKSEGRVKFILKDQTNKIAANMDNIIAKEYQAIAFQWKTRNDNRVVGKPGGINPGKGSKQHGDHWSRRDKWYYYPNTWATKGSFLNKDKFAGCVTDITDGLPGQPIGCRCRAKNYYELIDLPKELLSDRAKKEI